MFFMVSAGKTGIIAGKELEKIIDWIETGRENQFISRLINLAVLSGSDKEKELLKEEIEKSYNLKPPPCSFSVPESLHIDLTTRCRLNCPSCYKGKMPDMDMDFDFLKKILKEARKIKVFQIAFGGGEPLLYPFLREAVCMVKDYGMSSSITTGGWGFDEVYLQELIECGINHIQVSLNGSSPEINSLSRDGYKDALNALKLLSMTDISYGVNWVAMKDNMEDFPPLVSLVKYYGGKNINILRLKPGGNFKEQMLSRKEFILLGDYVKKYYRNGPVIKIDSSFSNLLCFIYKGKNNSFSGGCGAGRRFLSIEPSGNFRPCSHMKYGETFDTILDYWYNANILNKLRTMEEHIKGPCNTCLNLHKCRGCRVICEELYGDVHEGEKDCPSYIP